MKEPPWNLIFVYSDLQSTKKKFTLFLASSAGSEDCECNGPIEKHSVKSVIFSGIVTTIWQNIED